jgi:citrate transporter
MQTLQIILIFAIFFAGAYLMMTKKLPAILALPIMGILIAVIAGVPFKTEDPEVNSIMDFVIAKGGVKLASTIIVTIYGAIFAKIIQKKGISDSIIKRAAELAGDKPTIIAIVLTAAISIIFTAMSGAGAVIMVAQIAIPIFLASGIESLVAACLILFGLNIGLIFNVSLYQIFIDTIGMDIETIKSYSIVMGIISTIITLIYIYINVYRKGLKGTRKSWCVNVCKNNDVNVIALFTPILPIILVFFLKWNPDTALIVSIIITALIVRPMEMVQDLSSSVVEGIKDVAGVIGLMIGIGILLNAVFTPQSVELIQPVISFIAPTNPIMYIAIFTILSPLALYRGPLNMFGLGSGIAKILLLSGLSIPAVGMALKSTSMVQTVTDPTNTQNVIIAGFAKVDVNDILKSTLPYTMIMTLGILVYSAITLF